MNIISIRRHYYKGATRSCNPLDIPSARGRKYLIFILRAAHVYLLQILCRAAIVYRTNKNAGCIASIESAANIIDVIISIRIYVFVRIICKRREGHAYIIKRLRNTSYIKAESLQSKLHTRQPGTASTNDSTFQSSSLYTAIEDLLQMIKRCVQMFN